MKSLYLLETRSLGTYYVIADDPTQARNKLRGLLDKADYGFNHYREIMVIKLIARELTYFPEDKPNFSSDDTIIIW